MKLNWFSPLPPAQTGIAQVTASLFEAFRRRATVTFWTDQQRWDPAVEQFGLVRRYTPGQIQWSDLTSSDVTVYNMGNNMEFHSNMWVVSQQLPGITVLHDERYQHLFAGYYLSIKNDRDGYTSVMNRYYGRSGVQAVERLIAGGYDMEQMSVQYPLTALAMQDALGLIIHTPDGFDNLDRASHCPLAYLPLPHRAKSDAGLESSKAIRERRTGRPPYRLVVFGYLGPNRRLEVILKAIGGLRKKDQFRLHIYGPIWDEDLVCRITESCGLSGLVKLHGYTKPDALEAALAEADLALNLRYPTMGEASLTQLMIWDHALPSLVTRTGWYKHLPEDSVAFVRPDRELEDIQTHLNAFLDEPRMFAAMGERGRRVLLEKHSPEAYVLAILRMAKEVSYEQTRAAAMGLADRVGIDLGQWSGSASSSELLDRVSEEIASCFMAAEPLRCGKGA